MTENDLTKRVLFPGWVEQEDLPDTYNLAQAFAFQSVYEEFGIRIVEATACGCPIVSSSTGAIPEPAENVALLSDPFDDVAIADSILKNIIIRYQGK